MSTQTKAGDRARARQVAVRGDRRRAPRAGTVSHPASERRQAGRRSARQDPMRRPCRGLRVNATGSSRSPGWPRGGSRDEGRENSDTVCIRGPAMPPETSRC